MGQIENEISKNKFLERNVDFDKLSEEDKNIINNIPYIDFTYICNKCNKIPRIGIGYNKKDKFIEKLYFRECNSEMDIDLKNIYFPLKKKNLSSLYNENFMNIQNNNELDLKSKYLPFESINDLKEYIRVYKSYVELRNVIKEYNSGDTQKNQVFAFFEDLIRIGLFGLGTYYEYQNAIIIKDFLLDKFYIYNSRILLNNKSFLNNHGILYFKNAMNINHLKDNLFSIKYYNKRDYFFFIVKIDNIDDLFFLKENYRQYYKVDSYANIPNQLRKNFILFKNYYFKDIINLGKNKYILNTESNLILVQYDEIDNEYKKVFELLNPLKNNELIYKIYSLKNNNFIVFSLYTVLIYEFDHNDNSLICIKEFSNLIKGKDQFKEGAELINIIELKNGDLIFNYPKQIIFISGITYEIKSIINFNSWINSIVKLNNELIVNCDKFLLHYNLKNLKMTKKYKCEENCIAKNYYVYKNNLFILYDRHFEIRDYKSSKIIYSEKIEYSYYFEVLKFISICKNKGIFAIYSYNCGYMTLKIYEIINN